MIYVRECLGLDGKVRPSRRFDTTERDARIRELRAAGRSVRGLRFACSINFLLCGATGPTPRSRGKWLCLLKSSPDRTVHCTRGRGTNPEDWPTHPRATHCPRQSTPAAPARTSTHTAEPHHPSANTAASAPRPSTPTDANQKPPGAYDASRPPN